MKIILANKFYYPRGGDCIYTIELEKLLIANGNDVAVFTQQFKENNPSGYSEYWPSEVDYASSNITNIVQSLSRPIFSKEVKTHFKKLIDDFKPNLVHLNNIHSQLSPVIAQMAWEQTIPVVWTLHDYKLICPAYSCLRKGKICELCFSAKVNVVRHRCVKNIIGSSIAYLEALYWNRQKLQRYTSLFISPSQFLKNKMVQAGFSPDKIALLSNFIDDEKVETAVSEKEAYYCYFGRISSEKGLNTLLTAAYRLPYTLKIIGTGPLIEKYRQADISPKVQFLGYKNWGELKTIIRRAQFCVVPSECYENNPLSIIESFSLGTPVIGSDIGGIPELVEENKTGLLFEPGNVSDLENKIEYFFSNLQNKNLGENCIAHAQQTHKASQYYQRLLSLYGQAGGEN